MRYFMIAIIAGAVAGCATQPPAQETSAHRHAANIAAAEHAGYKVVAKNDGTLFCPRQAPIGSHIAVCLTEREWEQEQLFTFDWRVFNVPAPFTVAFRESY